MGLWGVLGSLECLYKIKEAALGKLLTPQGLWGGSLECLYKITEAALRKLIDSSGRSQRCSSACMWCVSLCVCSAGQCSRTCSNVPSELLQWGQLAS